MKSRPNNGFETFLNECNTYVWEWYIPEQYVRFGIPSLDGLWIDDKKKIFKLATVLERVHPDDIDKIFVRRSSPLYRSDKMFELDLRINHRGTGFEWFGFRGMTLRRDKLGRPTYVRGVAINIDQRARAQKKLLQNKDHQIQAERQKTEYCSGVMQEVNAFIRQMAGSTEAILSSEDSYISQKERLLQLQKVRDLGIRILDLTDKFRTFIGSRAEIEDRDFKKIHLWEHLAELQQVYSLKMSGMLKLYFSNLYDDQHILCNAKLFDVLIDNVIQAQIHNTRSGYLSIGYSLVNADTISISVTCTDIDSRTEDLHETLSEAGLGLSVCRLVAKRMFGDVQTQRLNDSRMQYLITLPVDVRKVAAMPSVLGDERQMLFVESPDVQKKETQEQFPPIMVNTNVGGQPLVLFGIRKDENLYIDQHLFQLLVSTTTDQFLIQFQRTQPDLVFIDYTLPGSISVDELLQKLVHLSPETPIIVTSDKAVRALHNHVLKLGARYLLNNPLTLRKVNQMIKKYLK